MTENTDSDPNYNLCAQFLQSSCVMVVPSPFYGGEYIRSVKTIWLSCNQNNLLLYWPWVCCVKGIAACQILWCQFSESCCTHVDQFSTHWGSPVLTSGCGNQYSIQACFAAISTCWLWGGFSLHQRTPPLVGQCSCLANSKENWGKTTGMLQKLASAINLTWDLISAKLNSSCQAILS